MNAKVFISFIIKNVMIIVKNVVAYLHNALNVIHIRTSN